MGKAIQRYPSHQFILRIGPRNGPQGGPVWKGCFLWILPRQIERSPGSYVCMFRWMICICIWYICIYDIYFSYIRMNVDPCISIKKNESKRNHLNKESGRNQKKNIEGKIHLIRNNKKDINWSSIFVHCKVCLNILKVPIWICLKKHPKPNPSTLVGPLPTSASFPKPGVTKGANTVANCRASRSSAWPVTNVSKKASLKSLQQQTPTTRERGRHGENISGLMRMDHSELLVSEVVGEFIGARIEPVRENNCLKSC